MQLKTNFLIIILLFWVQICYATPKKYSIYAGVGIPNYQFTVKDSNKNIETNMVRNQNAFFTFGYSRIPAPLFGNFIRWSLEFSLSPFHSNRQIADRITDVTGTNNAGIGKEIDMGTEVNGYVTYFNPTVDFYLPFSDDYYLYLGGGIGLGYAYLNGSYYQLDSLSSGSCKTSTTLSAIKANCTLNSVKINSIGISSNAIIVVNLNSIVFRAEIGGPEIIKNGHRYNTANQMTSLIYQYRF